MKLLICYGTRPEYIKLLPVMQVLRGRIPYKTLWVTQHNDSMFPVDHSSDEFLHVKKTDENRLDAVVGSMSLLYENIYKGITHVMVQGDTATAFMCATAAFHRQIPVIHLEAGLRTNDLANPYPEEGYRQMISRIASINLCPTDSNQENLWDENVGGKQFVVGNTVLDGLVGLRSSTNLGDEVLITMHRRENHADIAKWFVEFGRLAEFHPELKFTLPLHPNPIIQQHKSLLGLVDVVDPMSHDEFRKRLAACRFVITDSGGIQEECAFLGKKVIVCRKVTERPESVGETSFLCKAPNELYGVFQTINANPLAKQSNVFGRGDSAQRVLKALELIKNENL